MEFHIIPIGKKKFGIKLQNLIKMEKAFGNIQFFKLI